MLIKLIIELVIGGLSGILLSIGGACLIIWLARKLLK